MTSVNNCGYLRTGTGELVHRKIFEEHNGNIPQNCVIHHKNENKLDNALSNLELLTDEEHRKLHSIKNNPMRTTQGRNNNASKQTKTSVLHLGTFKDKAYVKGYRWRYHDKLNNIKFTSASLDKMLQKLKDNNIELTILNEVLWQETLSKEGLNAS